MQKANVCRSNGLFNDFSWYIGMRHVCSLTMCKIAFRNCELIKGFRTRTRAHMSFQDHWQYIWITQLGNVCHFSHKLFYNISSNLNVFSFFTCFVSAWMNDNTLHVEHVNPWSYCGGIQSRTIGKHETKKTEALANIGTWKCGTVIVATTNTVTIDDSTHVAKVENWINFKNIVQIELLHVFICVVR